MFVATMEFKDAAIELPDDDMMVMCADEEDVYLGFHLAGSWYSVDADEWPTVKAWADLPDPAQIIAGVKGVDHVQQA